MFVCDWFIDEHVKGNQVLSEVSSTKLSTNTENNKKYTSPKFTLMKEPENSYPEYLVFEIELPLQVISKLF